MRRWKEIRNDYMYEENDDVIVSIDAWKTCNDNEEGAVVARVRGKNVDDLHVVSIEYLDENAKTDEYAQEKIKEAKGDILEELASKTS